MYLYLSFYLTPFFQKIHIPGLIWMKKASFWVWTNLESIEVFGNKNFDYQRNYILFLDFQIVAFLTKDFAMQNVLKQIGLHVLSADGVVIKVTKTWILRCYTCYFTTPKMDKQFCPKCGNKTLKRVSVTLNADGSQQIHISTRRPLSTKGKKFSLPTQKVPYFIFNRICIIFEWIFKFYTCRV